MPAFETAPPAGSRILARLPGADFQDAWAIRAGDPSLSALGHFLKGVAATPAWVHTSMALRNRVARLVGLKNLGALNDIDPAKSEADYRPGDRLGIFTLIENQPEELLVGDSDRHLDVWLSVHRRPDGDGPLITVTTVVHTKGWLGRLYMLPVAPMHKLIVPRVLASLDSPA